MRTNGTGSLLIQWVLSSQPPMLWRGLAYGSACARSGCQSCLVELLIVIPVLLKSAASAGKTGKDTLRMIGQIGKDHGMV